MKKIITNEQMISISDLKKQAKIARKQNNNLSNHSQSLKAIAQSYDYDSWESLLDSAYLMVEKKQMPPKQGHREQVSTYGNYFLKKILVLVDQLKSVHEEYDFLNNHAGYNSLINFFKEELLNKYDEYSQQYQKLKLLIDLMVSLYLTHKSKNKDVNFKDIFNYADFGNNNPLLQKPLPEDVSNKLKKYMIFNNIYVSGLSLEQPLQVFHISYVEDSKQHHETMLDLEIMREKIEMMAEIYTKIEKAKLNNAILTDWLSDHESFIRLSLHNNVITEAINDYQDEIKRITQKKFNPEKHKEILNYLKYYLNGQYEEISIEVKIGETLHQKLEDLKKEGYPCTYNIEQAMEPQKNLQIYSICYLIH
jgi:hypothetical protein